MQFDNKKGTYRIWLQKFITPIILSPLLLTFTFSNFFDRPFWGFERIYWIIFFCVLWISVILYHRLTKPHFLSYSDRGNKITIRYFPIKPFNQKKHSIEIPKDRFVKFEIIKTGMYKSLVLFQNFKKGVGKYPPIPLSVLSKANLKDLENSLSQYVKK